MKSAVSARAISDGAARHLLEAIDRPLKSVAYDCGFGTADRVRQVFIDHMGTSHYRASFRVE